MNIFKKLFGILLIIIGVILGAYVGLYLCAWGGILAVYHGIVAGSFWLFVWGFIRFMLAGVFGWGLVYTFGLLGTSLLD